MNSNTAKISRLNTAKDISRKIFFILIGNLLCSIAFNVFFIPNGLLSGGVGGVGIMVQYLFDVPSGVTIFLINLPMFIIGARLVDREFAIYAFISMVVFSTLLTLTSHLGRYLVVDDILLASIFGGIFNGVGMGLMFRNRTCQSGLDIVATILKRKRNLNISTALMGFNTIIISLSAFLFNYKSAMYTLIALYIAYQILDKVQTGFNTKKNIVIISDKSEAIADAIITDVNRSVTFLDGRGGYTKEDKKVLYCIIKSNEVVKLKDIVESIDPAAFLTINEVVEVRGSGFENHGI